MRRTLWWAERIALLLFAAATLPGATSAASAPTAARAATEPAGASAAYPPRPPLDIRLLNEPNPSPLPGEDVPLPPAVFSAFPAGARVVALYGYPGVPTMGALGKFDPEGAAAEAVRLAEEWDRANADRPAVPAVELITSVAQPWPMEDGSYLARMPIEAITPYVEAARSHGLLLILDVQVGMAAPLAEVERLRPLLDEPFVHLALDPEFAMRAKGGVPGERIGSLDAADVNAVGRYLGAVVGEEHLPPKMLILHQFRADMLSNTDSFEDVTGVTRVVDMDGWGGQGVKLDNYAAYALGSYAQAAGIKLFLAWDAPMLTPEQLLALPRAPDLVIYQ